MALYGVTAIRVNGNNNRITHAKLGKIDGQTNKWIGEPEVVGAHDVGDLLLDGDNTVYSIHEIVGGRVLGAKAKYVVFDNGVESFDTLEPENHPGRTVRDLPAC
jgi:hypothetical protein